MIEPEQPMYTFTYETKETNMPYQFTPDERIEHLIYTIEKMNSILHACDSKFEHLYTGMINVLLTNLAEALLPSQSEESK